jgi:hypothetical protein
MSVRALQREQLLSGSLMPLTQVVFDNIERGRYYYVREREPGETPRDLYGRVINKTADSVVINVLFRRPGTDISGGVWESGADGDENGTYRVGRDLINSFEQDISARYYLPCDSRSSSSDSDSGSDSD